MKRTPLKRHTTLSRARRGARRVTTEEQAARAAWHLEAQRRGCEVHDGHVCIGPIQGHHVVEKRALKKWRTLIETALAFMAPPRTFVDVLYDTRNLMGVCEHRHEQHTGAFRRIGAEFLTAAHQEFADELRALGLHNLHTSYPVVYRRVEVAMPAGNVYVGKTYELDGDEWEIEVVNAATRKVTLRRPEC